MLWRSVEVRGALILSRNRKFSSTLVVCLGGGVIFEKVVEVAAAPLLVFLCFYGNS